MNKYTFKKIRWRIHPKIDRYEIRWFLIISDFIDFMDYLEHRTKQLMGAYFTIKSRPYEGHYRSDDELAVGMILGLCKTPRESIIDDTRIISDKLLSSYYHFYNDKGYLIINENGAITPINDYEVLEECKSCSFAWPSQRLTKKDIKITRWPEGKHFYAKIGTVDVRDEDGNIKWITESEAERQAKKFLERINHGRIQQNQAG